MNRRARLLCCLACALAAGGCCRALAEKAVEVGTDGAVKIADGGVTVTADGGTLTAGGTAKVPADWPADVPVYPGARLTAVGAGANVRTLVLTTVDSPAKVSAFYKTNLPGWTTTVDLTGPDGGLAQRTKGKMGLAVNITKSADGSAGFSLSHGPL